MITADGLVGLAPFASSYALAMALSIVPAFAISGLLVPVVPRWVWGALAFTAWAVAVALGAGPGRVPDLGAARLLQLVISGLLLGCVCALPWLAVQLGMGVFSSRHAAIATMLEVAVLWAFIAGGGLSSLVEIAVSSARVGLAQQPGDVARWVAAAAMHGMWLGVSIAAIAALFSVVVGGIAPRIDPEEVVGLQGIVGLILVLILGPFMLRAVMSGSAEVFGRLVALAAN